MNTINVNDPLNTNFYAVWVMLDHDQKVDVSLTMIGRVFSNDPQQIAEGKVPLLELVPIVNDDAWPVQCAFLSYRYRYVVGYSIYAAAHPGHIDISDDAILTDIATRHIMGELGLALYRGLPHLNTGFYPEKAARAGEVARDRFGRPKHLQHLQQQMAPHEMGTVAEIAERFGISKSEVRRRKAAGTLHELLSQQEGE